MNAIDIERVRRRVEAVQDWFLTEERWPVVGSALDDLESGLDRRDENTVRAVLDALQSLEEGGRRAKAQPGPAKTPIPPQQREQLNCLVRRLTLDLAQPRPAQDEGTEGTRRPRT
ncbi:CATRA system-associated protein [Streptomyces sp. NPDC005551]|uniref:CATRA system-associated protein n=1 Tax=unclassified Streptomyces TaxID=2593676 RepID=UPI0033F9D17E